MIFIRRESSFGRLEVFFGPFYTSWPPPPPPPLACHSVTRGGKGRRRREEIVYKKRHLSPLPSMLYQSAIFPAASLRTWRAGTETEQQHSNKLAFSCAVPARSSVAVQMKGMEERIGIRQSLSFYFECSNMGYCSVQGGEFLHVFGKWAFW